MKLIRQIADLVSADKWQEAAQICLENDLNATGIIDLYVDDIETIQRADFTPFHIAVLAERTMRLRAAKEIAELSILPL